MSNVERLKENWPMIPIGIALALLALALFLSPSEFTNLAWFALVALTAVYAYATIRVMRVTSKQTEETRRMIEEMKQSRLDAVKPSLSLQPWGFTFGGGFGALCLVNSGGVAKGVKIDITISNPPSKKSLFMTALDKEYMAYLPIDNIGELQRTGALVEIVATYKDGYNQSLSEHLSFDFSNLLKEGRGVIGQQQYSELSEIRRALQDIERKIRI